MGKLNNIDKAAAGKGSGINTLWQFVKFIVVSLGACIVQVASRDSLQHPRNQGSEHAGIPLVRL